MRNEWICLSCCWTVDLLSSQRQHSHLICITSLISPHTWTESPCLFTVFPLVLILSPVYLCWGLQLVKLSEYTFFYPSCCPIPPRWWFAIRWFHACQTPPFNATLLRSAQPTPSQLKWPPARLGRFPSPPARLPPPATRPLHQPAQPPSLPGQLPPQSTRALSSPARPSTQPTQPHPQSDQPKKAAR